MQILIALFFASATLVSSRDVGVGRKLSGGLEECEADCDLDSDCVSGLLCADEHKNELDDCGYDKRKADCGNVGASNHEVCFAPDILSDCNLDCDESGCTVFEDVLDINSTFTFLIYEEHLPLELLIKFDGPFLLVVDGEFLTSPVVIKSTETESPTVINKFFSTDLIHQAKITVDVGLANTNLVWFVLPAAKKKTATKKPAAKKGNATATTKKTTARRQPPNKKATVTKLCDCECDV